MDSKRKRLGDLLLENGVIDDTQLKSALEHQKKWNKRLGETLVDLGYISENTLMKVLSKFLGLPSINLNQVEVEMAVIKKLPMKMIEQHQAVPIAVRKVNHKDRLIVAMADPSNLEAIDEMQFTSGFQIVPMVTSLSSFRRFMDRVEAGPNKLGDFTDDRSGVSMIAPKPGDSRISLIRGGDEEVVRLDESEDSDSDGETAGESEQENDTKQSIDTKQSEEDAAFSAALSSGFNAGAVLQEDTGQDISVEGLGKEIDEGLDESEAAPSASPHYKPIEKEDSGLFSVSDLNALDDFFGDEDAKAAAKRNAEEAIEDEQLNASDVVSEIDEEEPLEPVLPSVDAAGVDNEATLDVTVDFPEEVSDHSVNESESVIEDVTNVLITKSILDGEDATGVLDSDNPVEALITRLKSKGVLSEEEADQLLKREEGDDE